MKGIIPLGTQGRKGIFPRREHAIKGRLGSRRLTATRQTHITSETRHGSPSSHPQIIGRVNHSHFARQHVQLLKRSSAERSVRFNALNSPPFPRQPPWVPTCFVSKHSGDTYKRCNLRLHGSSGGGGEIKGKMGNIGKKLKTDRNTKMALPETTRPTANLVIPP